jgi:urea transporter
MFVLRSKVFYRDWLFLGTVLLFLVGDVMTPVGRLSLWALVLPFICCCVLLIPRKQHERVPTAKAGKARRTRAERRTRLHSVAAAS